MNSAVRIRRWHPVTMWHTEGTPYTQQMLYWKCAKGLYFAGTRGHISRHETIAPSVARGLRGADAQHYGRSREVAGAARRVVANARQREGALTCSTIRSRTEAEGGEEAMSRTLAYDRA
jgi:hypothetical protein